MFDYGDSPAYNECYSMLRIYRLDKAQKTTKIRVHFAGRLFPASYGYMTTTLIRGRYVSVVENFGETGQKIKKLANYNYNSVAR